MDGRSYQTQLAEVLSETLAVKIFDGGMQSGERIGSELLATIDEPSDLAELSRLLAVGGPSGHCMCYGDTTFELCNGDGTILAVLGLHHGVSLRWEVWGDDAWLINGRALMEWLSSKGVGGPRQRWFEDEADRQASISQYSLWLLEIPAALESLKEQMDDLKLSGGGLSGETLQELGRLLEAAFPDAVERAGVLLRWFGSGSGQMSGFASYEAVPEQFLARVPIQALVDALTDADDAILDGGVRYLAGWTFVKTRGPDLAAVPPSLREVLLSRAESSGDGDKIQRARRAFA